MMTEPTTLRFYIQVDHYKSNDDWAYLVYNLLV